VLRFTSVVVGVGCECDVSRSVMDVWSFERSDDGDLVRWRCLFRSLSLIISVKHFSLRSLAPASRILNKHKF
jgi:hypothetical protein